MPKSEKLKSYIDNVSKYINVLCHDLNKEEKKLLIHIGIKQSEDDAFRHFYQYQLNTIYMKNYMQLHKGCYEKIRFSELNQNICDFLSKMEIKNLPLIKADSKTNSR